MRFKIEGKFQADTIKEFPGKKDPAKTFRGGDAVFHVTYEHENGETGEMYQTEYDVPFRVFGDKQCDLVQTLQFDQECEIWFEVAGREYQGKYFAENKVSVIKAIGKANTGSPSKPNPARQAPQAPKDEDIPF